MGRLSVYVGTYTREGGPGIVVMEFCPAAGRLLGELQRIEVENPSFLAVPPNLNVAYAVNEVCAIGDVLTGGLYEFDLHPVNGRLAYRRQWPTGGAAPAHVAIDAAGEWLGVANYRGASIGVGRLNAAGHLLSLEPTLHCFGSSIHPTRQTQSHPHQIVFHRGHAWVPDLGADQIIHVKLSGTAVAACRCLKLPRGAGPRHLAFHRSGDWGYALCELSSEIGVFPVTERDAEPQVLGAIYSSRGRKSRGPNQAAAIKLHPNGTHLFCSNRGDDTISVFRIGHSGAELEWEGTSSTGGSWPRDFLITPDGRWLIAANQHSGNLAIFPIEAATGLIGFQCQDWPIKSPACVTCRTLAG